MAFLNGTADLPTTALSRFQTPQHAPGESRGNVLHDLADYIRSATFSDVAHEAATSVCGILVPVWLQRYRRIKLLEKMMKEVKQDAPRLEVTS